MVSLLEEKTKKDNRIRIAYVTSTDARDRRSWSGTHYFVAQALQKYCGEVHYIGPLNSRSEIFLKFLARTIRVATIGRKRYSYLHSVAVSKDYARAIGLRVSRESFDLIFAPGASTEIAHLDTSVPVVYLSDTTFTLMVNYNKRFTDLIKTSVREGNSVEDLAIKKASLVLYSSEWAAASAVNDYGADSRKIRVVPFGANVDDAPPGDFVTERRLNKRNDAGKCKLLFLGVSWHGKGGGIAFDTLLELERMGIDAELIVCGCTPPKRLRHRNLIIVPFLDKNKPDEHEKIKQLLLGADFLLLPTRYDCSPIVFCEANAFGLPVITTDTGGISSMIKNGVNGFMLPMEARGSDYADLIQRVHSNRSLYRELVLNSRREFERRLNWDAWGVAVGKAIEEVIGYKIA